MAGNLIQIKRTSVPGRVPTLSNLTIGELALNMADGILYSSDGSKVFEIGANNTNLNVSANLTINALIANGSIGSVGQILVTNSMGAYWHTRYTGSDTSPSGNNLVGDIWFDTNAQKPYMWVELFPQYPGYGSWYDFLPYTGS